MDCHSTRISYRQTGSFSKLTIDYLEQAEALKPFFAHAPTLGGISAAIKARQGFATDRKLLAEQLEKQYGSKLQGRVAENIRLLTRETTFTVTTAHQPNIFTGPLYFIYKILHAIRLAGSLKQAFPEFDFVPVYYMGCEDADLDELGHLYLDGRRVDWKTSQKGAVGRMLVDEDFVRLLADISGQLEVLPFGKPILEKLREFYHKGEKIQDATFALVDYLFASYGLVVLIPDNRELKKSAAGVFEEELLQQRASELVGKQNREIGQAGYKVQAQPREINLFYLADGMRERIEADGSGFRVVNTSLSFSRAEMLTMLTEHPERFSPNVILRGLFQELILPNIAFIGGGGELAYWLQYRTLFAHFSIPFPALVLRNSFLVLEPSWQEAIAKTGFQAQDMFVSSQELMNRVVQRESSNSVKLNGSLTEIEKLYETVRQQAIAVDQSLSGHVDALRTRALYRLQELEKKMLRAEKRKYEALQRQILRIREKLFPGDGLQERVDNMLYFYAKWGESFIRLLFDHSLSLEQEFVILSVHD